LLLPPLVNATHASAIILDALLELAAGLLRALVKIFTGRQVSERRADERGIFALYARGGGELFCQPEFPLSASAFAKKFTRALLDRLLWHVSAVQIVQHPVIISEYYAGSI
jgi:hypothetical protein